jgi:hypothetical protein
MDFLEIGTTINSEHYIDIVTLKPLKQRLRWVWKHKKNILLQHDNAGPHTSRTTMEVTEKVDCAILPHLPAIQSRVGTMQLPLFPQMKVDLRSVWLKWRGGKDCHDLDEETNCGVLLWWLWETCPSLAKCVENGGDYVEKVNTGDKRPKFKNYLCVSFINISLLKQN